MKFTRYDAEKVMGKLASISFIQQAYMAKANSGRVLMVLHTPLKRRGNTEQRMIVLFCSDKFREYLEGRLLRSNTDKKKVQNRLSFLSEIENHVD